MSIINKFVNEGYRVFVEYKRPVQCIDHQGDPEYRDHEESLKNITCSNLTMEHVGQPGYHPMHALAAEAFSHFLPKLIEFAVMGVIDKSGEPFMFLFTSVVGYSIKEQKCELLGSEQIEFLYRTFLLLNALYLPLFRKYGYETELNEAIEHWKT